MIAIGEYLAMSLAAEGGSAVFSKVRHSELGHPAAGQVKVAQQNGLLGGVKIEREWSAACGEVGIGWPVG